MSFNSGLARRAATVAVVMVGLAGCVAQPRHYDLSADVLFDTGSARLKPAANDALNASLQQIASSYRAPSIIVIGHTDAVGSPVTNEQLSLRRAQAVQAWLVSAGVQPGAIQTQGVGAAQPVASDADPAGRAANRRVELIVSGG